MTLHWLNDIEGGIAFKAQNHRRLKLKSQRIINFEGYLKTYTLHSLS